MYAVGTTWYSQVFLLQGYFRKAVKIKKERERRKPDPPPQTRPFVAKAAGVMTDTRGAAGLGEADSPSFDLMLLEGSESDVVYCSSEKKFHVRDPIPSPYSSQLCCRLVLCKETCGPSSHRIGSTFS